MKRFNVIEVLTEFVKDPTEKAFIQMAKKWDCFSNECGTCPIGMSGMDTGKCHVTRRINGSTVGWPHDDYRFRADAYHSPGLFFATYNGLKKVGQEHVQKINLAPFYVWAMEFLENWKVRKTT